MAKVIKMDKESKEMKLRLEIREAIKEALEDYPSAYPATAKLMKKDWGLSHIEAEIINYITVNTETTPATALAFLESDVWQR